MPITAGKHNAEHCWIEAPQIVVPASCVPPEDSSEERTVQPVQSVAGLPGEDEQTVIKTISALFVQLLGVDQVGPDSDFFDFGGHSIVGTALCQQLSRKYHIRFELNDLYQASTPKQMADS
ncbi:MAG: acyl carrier protein, partial [Fuerstiella sp.]|nr:acyl carrier protein [Fuerstiella sp.]